MNHLSHAEDFLAVCRPCLVQPGEYRHERRAVAPHAPQAKHKATDACERMTV